MYKNKKISLVIPARNEEKLIKPTLKSIPGVIDKIYVIDDGSTDNMAEAVKKQAQEDSRVELISNEENVGPGGSIIKGYLKSSDEGYDIAVVIGGDNQMPIEDVGNFLDPLIEEDYDYTKGNRFLVEENVFEDMPNIRLLGNSIISLLTKIASGHYKLFDFVDGYTAITKRAIDTLNWNKAWKKYGYPMDFLIRLNAYGFNTKDIPRKAIYLEGERQSQIKGLMYALQVSPMLIKGFFWRLFKRYFYRDFHPLFFLYLFGILFMVLGVLWGLYLIYFQITGVGVSGPRAVIDAILLIVGFQSFWFGMLFDMYENNI